MNTHHNPCEPFLVSIYPDLHIQTKNKGNVKIQKMESDVCHVHTEEGHCILKGVKVMYTSLYSVLFVTQYLLLLCLIVSNQGHEVLVHSNGGNVTGLNTIHGNVEIRASGDSVNYVKPCHLYILWNS